MRSTKLDLLYQEALLKIKNHLAKARTQPEEAEDDSLILLVGAVGIKTDLQFPDTKTNFKKDFKNFVDNIFEMYIGAENKALSEEEKNELYIKLSLFFQSDKLDFSQDEIEFLEKNELKDYYFDSLCKIHNLNSSADYYYSNSLWKIHNLNSSADYDYLTKPIMLFYISQNSSFLFGTHFEISEEEKLKTLGKLFLPYKLAPQLIFDAQNRIPFISFLTGCVAFLPALFLAGIYIVSKLALWCLKSLTGILLDYCYSFFNHASDYHFTNYLEEINKEKQIRVHNTWNHLVYKNKLSPALFLDEENKTNTFSQVIIPLNSFHISAFARAMIQPFLDPLWNSNELNLHKDHLTRFKIQRILKKSTLQPLILLGAGSLLLATLLIHRSLKAVNFAICVSFDIAATLILLAVNTPCYLVELPYKGICAIYNGTLFQRHSKSFDGENSEAPNLSPATSK